MATLLLLFGAYTLVDGIVGLIGVFIQAQAGPRWVLALHGLAGTAAGLLALGWPGFTALALLYLVAAWAILVGISTILAAMDVGTIAIYLSGGTPLVARCDEAPSGLTFVPALNADALAEAARRVLELEGVDLSADGLYLCPDELSAEAQFPPITLPSDLISYASARAILYPDLDSKNTGLQRVRRDVQAGRLRAYRIGSGHEMRQFVSRTQVRQLAAQLSAQASA